MAAQRSGLTLLELLIVIVLLGVTFGLAVPRFLDEPREREDAVQRVIDAARRQAIANAAAVSLSFAADGHWLIESGEQDTRKQASGAIAWPYTFPVRLHISALGACTIEAPEGAPLRIDPVRCAMRSQ
jgi:prepilin-type N-terminal cleavage/methylation domain-containing protein